MLLILVYLVAIVLANLVVNYFGQPSVLYVAFFLVSLDITTRDYLHDNWKNSNLFLKMLTLIGIGSILTFLINIGAWNIALASFVAFFLSNLADMFFYSYLDSRGWSKYYRINGSNGVSSLLDSFLFLTIAFWSILPILILKQTLVKILGGLFWSTIIKILSKINRG